MMYQCKITIEKPISEVVEKMEDPNSMQYWMEGFLRMEPISGEPGTLGAKSKIYFMNKGKEFSLLETILEQNMPDDIKLQYEGPSVTNTVHMQFKEIGPNQTQIISDNQFNFSGFMKYFAWMMKGMFSKQSMKYLHAFKAFVEEGKTV